MGNSGSGFNTFTKPKAGCILGTMDGKSDRYCIRINNTSGKPVFAGSSTEIPISYSGNGQFFFCLKKGDKFSLTNAENSFPYDFRYRIMYFN